MDDKTVAIGAVGELGENTKDGCSSNRVTKSVSVFGDANKMFLSDAYFVVEGCTLQRKV